jgi:hypothetical protein
MLPHFYLSFLINFSEKKTPTHVNAEKLVRGRIQSLDHRFVNGKFGTLQAKRKNVWFFWRTPYLLSMGETGEFRECGRLLPQVVCGGRRTDEYSLSLRDQTKK